MVNVKEAAPESEEQKVKQKCNELRKRIQEVEECNEISLLALSRTRASIRRSRMQYVVLLERLQRQLLPLGKDVGPPQSPILIDDQLQIQGAPTSVEEVKKAWGVGEEDKPLSSPSARSDQVEGEASTHDSEALFSGPTRNSQGTIHGVIQQSFTSKGSRSTYENSDNATKGSLNDLA